MDTDEAAVARAKVRRDRWFRHLAEAHGRWPTHPRVRRAKKGAKHATARDDHAGTCALVAFRELAEHFTHPTARMNEAELKEFAERGIAICGDLVAALRKVKEGMA